MASAPAYLTPGVFVANPARPDWGRGQVQSSIGGKVTVNFEDIGKVVIDTSEVVLIPVSPDN